MATKHNTMVTYLEWVLPKESHGTEKERAEKEKRQKTPL